MITPYYRPQHRIFQNLRDTATNAVKRSGSLVVGTQYLLALNDGRELPESAFSSAGGNLFYRHIENGVTKTIDALRHKVALGSVKLFGRDLEVDVATGITTLVRSASDNRLRFSNSDNLAGTGLAAALGGRSVRVGDLLVVRADNATAGSYVSADSTFYRKVTKLLGRVVPSSVTSTTGAATNAIANASASNAITSQTSVAAYAAGAPTLSAATIQKISELGGRFNGKLGEEITLVCVTGGAQTVASFQVSYTTLGTSEFVTPTGSTTAFNFALPGLAAGTVVALTHTGAAVQGDTIRLVLAPVFTPVVPATVTVVNQALYTGAVSTSYIVEVVKGGVSVATDTFPAGTSLRIYDSSGGEPVQVAALTNAASGTGIALGTRGLTFTIPTTTGLNLVTGDKYVVAVTAPMVSTTAFDGVELDGPTMNPGSFDLVTGKFSVDVRVTYSGEVTTANAADASAYVAGASQVVYDPAMGLSVDKGGSFFFLPFINARGKLRVAFKAGVIAGSTEGPIKVTSRAALAAGQLGELSISNDLAYGAYLALSGSGDTAVSALRTSEDTLPAFEAAFRKIRGTDIYYSITPQTDSLDVIKFAALHCEEMSLPENMNFRRSYFGTDSPGRYTAWDTLSDGSYRTATLVGDLVTVDPAHAAVSNFASDTLPTYVGDVIRFLSLASDLVITEVVSVTSVRVSGAPPLGVATAAAFQLIKPDTADNTIDFVIGRSLQVENRRAINVWCDRPTALINGEPTVISSKFLAAEIAGLRSALRPQQGLTMTEVTAIDDAPAMFARFTPEQLDRAAAAGVMIVTQEVEGGEIFIRHQLTTQTSKGALQYEDNPGVVVDTFSFRIKDAFRNYLGKKNVTPTTLAEIYSELKQLAIDATQIEALNDDSVGALILGFSDENGKEGEVTVAVDGDLADKVRTFVNLRVALPLNGLTHYVDASASVTI